MLRYDKLSKVDEEDEGEAEESRPVMVRTRSSSYQLVSRHGHTLLLVVFLVTLMLQSVQLHKTNTSFKNELSLLKQSVGEDMALQKLSENTSNAHVLLEVTRLRGELATTKQQLKLQNLETKAQVSDKMDVTVQQLDVAIHEAKEDIRKEVDQVRHDMSSYISSTDLALKAESDFIKFEIAGTFSILACLISVYNMWCHLRHFAKPSIQRRILAILIMVPVYSLTSWLSLILATAEPFLSAVRDCYEAYIVYTFMAMLVEILGNNNGPNAAMLVLAQQIKEDRKALDELTDLLDSEHGFDMTQATLSSQTMNDSNLSSLNSAPPIFTRAESASHNLLEEASASTAASLHDVRPPCPCSYDERSPKSTAAAILYQCQILAMQFVFLKPVLAAFPFFLELGGVPYTDHSLITEQNHIDWTSPKLYVYAILNISVSLAFYGLMKFYYATATQLSWCDPWPKFLTIKVVVFMTFWQGIAITGMSLLGLVDEQSGMAAQNILICIEMLLASLMHHLFFPYREWQEGYKKEKEKDTGLSHLRDTLVLRDFVKDVKGMITQQVWKDVPQIPQQPSSENKIGLVEYFTTKGWLSRPGYEKEMKEQGNTHENMCGDEAADSNGLEWKSNECDNMESSTVVLRSTSNDDSSFL